MKIALISDVHGNLEALESTLRDIEKSGIEKIYFLGDAVGYGCNPNECVRLIDKNCDIKLLGNHDYAAMGIESTDSFNQLAQTSIDWTMKKMTDKSISTLADFELQATFLDYYLVHSSPDAPEAWNYILNPGQAAEQFTQFPQSACFIGHSHLPTIFTQNVSGTVTQHTKPASKLADDKRYIINIGSVGQPRDNDPRACYLIVDTENQTAIYRRVEYDLAKTQKKVRNNSFPEFLAERLASGI
jgi:diadenosine tetraphosphatase ApaH/serine/threonine PP2A family protein phosphatase